MKLTIFILSEMATLNEHKFKNFSFFINIGTFIKKKKKKHIYLQHAVTLKLKVHQIRYTERERLHFSLTINDVRLSLGFHCITKAIVPMLV